MEVLFTLLLELHCVWGETAAETFPGVLNELGVATKVNQTKRASLVQVTSAASWLSWLSWARKREREEQKQCCASSQLASTNV